MKKLLAAGCGLWALALSASAVAQRPTPDAQRPPTITLLTMGVGEEIWEQFGHNALWIHDPDTNSDIVYNWGLFDFNQPHFIPRFLKGEMLYSMGGFGLDETLAEYRARDRTVTAQVLNLTPAQAAEIVRYVEWNAQPENRNYYYNYFTDNCSTRVRDVIDRALGGAIKRAADSILTVHSYRWHALRLTQSNPALATGIDVGLGRPSDPPLTMWQAMFLPMQLRDFVRTVRVPDERGTMRPLVASETVLLQTQTHPEPSNAPELWIGLLAIGVIVAAVCIACARMQSRVGLAVIGSVWSLVAGLLGLLLTLLWTVTDHTFAHHNENLLFFQPLWLALVVMLPVTVIRGRWRRATLLLVDIGAAGALVALVIHFIGISRQDDWALLCAAVPASVALGWAVRRVSPPR